jgi:glyoxylase-like metal-dependent hydrolase (beta-lactamase superfamily II)
MKILDSIFLIPSSVNCYLIEREEECVLIDTGMSKKAKSIIQTIEANCANKPLTAVIITHAHLDHYDMVLKL